MHHVLYPRSFAKGFLGTTQPKALPATDGILSGCCLGTWAIGLGGNHPAFLWARLDKEVLLRDQQLLGRQGDGAGGTEITPGLGGGQVGLLPCLSESWSPHPFSNTRKWGGSCCYSWHTSHELGVGDDRAYMCFHWALLGYYPLTLLYIVTNQSLPMCIV